MVLTRLYYFLKPFVPPRLRLALRRFHVRHILKRCADHWPIQRSAARKPVGWTGWPDGKQFAFVITHDVESRRGLDRVKQLAELEMQFGIRSTFNFIPEGPYEVPGSLRSWLTERGFEVGVHDLHHDGKLYSSRAEFRRKATRINRYLKEWNVTGFRSGFMLRRLDWLHDLKIGYDSSTFDTDPFEPQSDGAGTIFPFWVPGPVADHRSPITDRPSGYVELPYTLPQDSTLFLIMGEKSVEIWKRKLDWIVRHGGMALVNIHPDYIQFPEDPPVRGTYPVARIEEFLKYVSANHGVEAWRPAPTHLADWYRETHRENARPLVSKRAAILLYSYYPADPRPRRAAEALADAGMQVDLLCLRERDSDPRQEIINGVQVHRTSLRRKRDSKLTYLIQYGRFILQSFFFLAWRTVGGGCDLVHVHNMPDVLVFAALLPKLLGARIILDLHDPMPELMMGIYGVPADHFMVRLLRRLERLSIRFADLVLTPNLAFRRLFESRSCLPGKMEIVMNSPESGIFDPDRFSGTDIGPSRTGSEFHIMHHGSIVHRHGVDLLVEAVARVRPKIPGVRLHIYGSRTPFLDEVLAVATRLGVEGIVHFHGPKPQSEIALAIRECHLGVVPNRRSAFTELNFPTRLFEYLAMHRPVIAPATRGIQDYFAPDEMIMFDANGSEDLASRILWVHANPESVIQLVERGRAVYRRHLWSAEKARFIARTNTLVADEAGEFLSASTEENEAGQRPPQSESPPFAAETPIKL